MATKTKAGTERRGADASCFKEVEVLLTLALPPSGLRDINAAVCSRLNQSLMKYVALGEGGAGGVLVAYWGVALEGSCGRIMYEQPELHCRVRLHALFFAPSPGLTLVGEVNKVGSDHVGLLVAGAFNASVSRDAVPADFAAVTTTTTTPAAKEKNEDQDENEGEDDDDDDEASAAASVTAVECWRSTTDPTRELSPGRYAAFQTTAVNTSRGIITIFGSMLAPRTGPLRQVPGLEASKPARESQPHEQHQEAEEAASEEATQLPGSEDAAAKKEKKKRSKRKAKETDEEAAEEEEEKAEEEVKAKPAKTKKEKTPKKKKRRTSDQ